MQIKVISATLFLFVATAVDAKPHLREVAEIDDGILWIGIANEIRTRCDNIGARMVRAMTTARGLHNRAQDLGYSEDEIKTYVTSKAEKDRMRRRGADYLASKGTSLGDETGLCALGLAEIDRNSAIGVLLRAK